MRVVSIGDLVTDYYYKNGKLLGVNGGMTSHNIIANLSKNKIDTCVFGVCGNDTQGEIAIKSLNDLDVETSNVEILDNTRTRCFHVSYIEDENGLTFTSKKKCLYCNNKKWYEESLINVPRILSKINEQDILVFDNLNDKNQEIVDSTKNLKLIDLGQFFEFEKLSDEKIINKINKKFKIINLNERVEKYFLNRFNLKNDLDLYKLFNVDLITITMGKKGAKFLFNEKTYEFKLELTAKEIDSTGAGDAFFSSIIDSWLKNGLKIEESKFLEWYKKSCKLTRKVVQKMGARGHLKSLYKIKIADSICTCEKFISITRKQIKRCNININNLETRIINAINSNAFRDLDNINFNSEDNYIFAGTGGSFAAAKFASIVINKIYGSNTYALYPRDIAYRNNNKINKVILFSYSGTTNDLLEGTNCFDNENKYIFTKGEQQKIILKTNIAKKNIITYRTGSNKGKEKGFLSFEGAVAPAAVFLKFYYSKIEKQFNVDEFIKNSFRYWNDFFQEKFKQENIQNIFNIGNIVNIFRGDYTDSACSDIESKLIESGIVNCIIHEKKNFSHGRFINYENLNNKNNIYFKQKSISSYEEKLLDYLKSGNNLIIESKYDGILCEFDLLLASQLLPYYIGKTLDIDMSKPKYSEESMKIYFYKGEL